MIAGLVRFSVRHAGLVVALAVALVGFGVARLTGASLDVFPEFSPAQVVVQTEAPGLSAPGVETLVTQPVEQAVAGIAGLQALRSQSIPGLSVVTVLFDEGGDIHRHRQQVAERLAQAVPQLPPGVVPAMTPLTSSASTVLGLGVTSATLDGTGLRTLVERQLRPPLMAVAGVADVNVFGGLEAQWQVQADPQRLARSGLSLAELAESLRQATGVRPAGFVENANQRIALALQPPGAQGADTVAELERSVLRPAADGRAPLLLRDVARVVAGGAPAVNGALINGQPGVFLMVQGQLGANTRDTTAALDTALQALAPVLARQGAMLHADLFRPARFIDTAVGHVRRDVLIGAALVVAVLFGFLYNVRTALVSAVAIPLSLLAAVMVLQAFGMSLNIMILGGLAIALGEVVDDAIIDCENIFRRLRENRQQAVPAPAHTVVYAASMEVRSSMLYATFIVALVFVPLLMLSGVAGRLFAPLGLAYIAAILASLGVALTVTPAMSMLLLTRRALPPGDPPLVAWLRPRYRALLLRVERHRTAVFTAVGLGMAVGIGVLPLLGGGFIPPLKEGHFIVHMSALPGTSLPESLRIGQRVDAVLRGIDGVESVAQWVGRARNGADTFGPHYSEFEVEIGQRSGAEQQRILGDIRQALSGGADDDGGPVDPDQPGFTGLQFAVNTFLTERIGETVSGFSADIAVQVFGNDLDALDRDGRAVAALLAAQPGARDVQLLAPPGAPELQVRLRGDRLAALGLSSVPVMEAVQVAFDGLEVGRMQAAGESGTAVPVILMLTPDWRTDPDAVRQLPLQAGGGSVHRLADVADVTLVQGRYKVLREGGRRVQSITANLARGQDPEVFVARLRQALSSRVTLAPGHQVQITGTAEAQARARSDLLGSAALAAAGVAALLLLAFGSLRHLALTFVNLPFALIGGVVAVLASGGWLTLGSVVGFVTLFGITLRNSIMLVSHYQHLVEVEQCAWNLDTALRGAGERLPSILMTALVTGLSLAPLALGSAEPGREIEGPMATIIVGGLVSSTLLNLLVLPAVLLRWGRFRATQPAP